MGINFIKSSDGTISAFVKGRSFLISKDHFFYSQVVEALKNKDENEFVRFADLKETIETFSKTQEDSTNTNIQVKDGVVYYKNKPLHNVITNKIMDYIREGLDSSSLINFLEKLMKNPSKHSVDQLFSFLEHKFLPIHEDGDFLGYKRVRADYLDFHTGTILNEVGTYVEVERNTVDDDYSKDCSHGLHVGTRDYVKGFNASSNSRVLLVKVNPADVVSVPKYDSTKMRVCRYFILEELDNKEFGIDSIVYNARPAIDLNEESLNAYDDSCNHECDDYVCANCDKEELSCSCEDEDDEDDDNLCEYCGYEGCEGECEDEEDNEFLEDDDEDESLGVNSNKLDFSEWAEEVCQGKLKEDLLSVIQHNTVLDCDTYSEAFVAISRMAYLTNNDSLINLLNKSETRTSYSEIYDVEF